MAFQSKDIHMFKYKDTRLVYDVNSGSLHRVDDLGWDLLALMMDGLSRQDIITCLNKSYPFDEINAALLEVAELQKNKLLFSPDHLVMEDTLKPRRIKSLCLFVTHGCNLGCRYCFARKEGNSQPRPMTSEIAQKAVDFLLEPEGPRHREVDFFGGEPLLNFSLIRDTVDYAKNRSASLGREVAFTVTTNGLLLDDEVADFLIKENINVIISIDGRPEVHDLMRSRVDGKGSYETTVRNAENLLIKKGFNNYYIRGTYTRENLDFCKDLKHFLELGFESLSLEPVIIDKKEPYALSEGDLPRLEEEYDRVVNLYLERKLSGRPFIFYHFEMDLGRGPCLYKRLSGCGSGTEYLAVSPEGDLYPCHQFVGEKAFLMGNLLEEPFYLRSEIGEKVSRAAQERAECCQCWARYLCGMGCSASSFFMAGDLKKNYYLGCKLQRIRLERALYLQAACAVPS